MTLFHNIKFANACLSLFVHRCLRDAEGAFLNPPEVCVSDGTARCRANMGGKKGDEHLWWSR